MFCKKELKSDIKLYRLQIYNISFYVKRKYSGLKNNIDCKSIIFSFMWKIKYSGIETIKNIDGKSIISSFMYQRTYSSMES